MATRTRCKLNKNESQQLYINQRKAATQNSDIQHHATAKPFTLLTCYKQENTALKLLLNKTNQ